MPDSRAHDPMPRDWGDAFAALPLATPPEAGWQRLAAALPPAQAPARPARWRRPALALVATTFFAAVIPLMHWRAVHTAPPLQRPANGTMEVTAVVPKAVVAPVVTPPLPPPTETSTPAPAAVASATVRRPTVRSTPTRLDALYTESARLEAVLAHLPDGGTGNVAALAVSAELQDQVSHIDLALSQPALPDVTRTALWEQRVDTLRQLTGVEATQRWQVALNDTGDY